MKLIVILADAELELLPELKDKDEELEAVQSMHSIPILDAYFHQDLMQTFPEKGRRGRGDIVHNCLSLLQNSISNRKGILKVYVHTRDDKVIDVAPGAEVPPNYIQFLKEMGTLLKGGNITGFSLRPMTFKDLVADLNADLVVSMSPTGQGHSLATTMENWSSGKVAVVVGAFPMGDYRSPVDKLADMRISLGPKLLTAPQVVFEVLQSVPKAAQKST